MAYDENNVFAKILRGELPCIELYEDKKTLSFMDAMPQTDGHALIVPKYKAENMLELDPEFASGLILTTQKIAKAVKKAFDCPGIFIAQLNGKAAGQTVFHVHTHVIPRYEGIDMKLHARELADVALLEKQATRIRAFL